MSILLTILVLLGVSTLLFVTVHPNRVTAAALCEPPFTVTILTPTTTQTLCIGDSFTFSGRFRDSNLTQYCSENIPYGGYVNTSLISTTTPVKVSSGTYSGSVNSESTSWSKTVYAYTAGTHTIKFRVYEPLPSNEYYESSTKTVYINPLVDWGAVSLSYSSISTDSIIWSWTDITNETNYRIMDTGDNNKSGDLAANTTSYEEGSLSANTQYTRYAQVVNSCNTDDTSDISVYTSAVNPDVTSDLTEDTWTNNDEIIFTNSAGFGEGGVEYYRYAFNQNSSHTFTDSETQWSSGNKTLTATSDGSWYLHVKAFNGDDVAADSGATTSLGPFKIDTTPANVSGINVLKTTDSATITWTTSEATTTQIAWGLTDSYGNLTEEDTDLTTSHSVTLSGLNDDTTYHYKIMGDDQVGNATASADRSFTTSELEATVITNVQVTVISETSVKVTWTTNHAADSKVRYGLTTAYGQEVYESELVTSHEITLTGLTAKTTYHYEVLSTGNTTTYDADATFTTEVTVYVASPTIVKTEVNPIEEGAIINEVSPTITGLARSNNTIFIFIDGELENTVLSTDHPSGTGSFAYKLRRILPEGEHTLYTISRDADGNYSDRSPVITFTVDHPYVAPTLFDPVFTDGDNPTIIINGVARNNSIIKLYIDDIYCCEYEVVNNPNFENTYFNFSYSLSDFNEGRHSVKLKAFSQKGEASKFSNAYSFQKKITANLVSEQFYFDESLKYTVESGDSLWKIAERFYGQGSLYTNIVQANKEKYPALIDNPSVLQIGWHLTIP